MELSSFLFYHEREKGGCACLSPAIAALSRRVARQGRNNRVRVAGHPVLDALYQKLVCVHCHEKT